MADHYWKDREKAPYGVARLGDTYDMREVFEKFPKREKSVGNNYGFILTAGIIGAGMWSIMSFYEGKRFYTKFWHSLAVGASLSAAVYLALHYRDKADARTQAICKDYISLHPERFPPIQRKKFKDCLHDWHPERWFN